MSDNRRYRGSGVARSQPLQRRIDELPLTLRERGRVKRDQGVPETPAETLRAFGVDDCVRTHGRKAAERAEAALWAEVARQTERERAVAAELADDRFARAAAKRRSIARGGSLGESATRPPRCKGVRLVLRGEDGRASVVWKPCDTKRGCPECGTRIMAEHLAPARRAVERGRDVFVGAVDAEHYPALKRRLQRAGADAKRLPITSTTAVVVASEPFTGSHRASIEALDDAARDHLAHVRAGGKARISGLGTWKRESAEKQGSAELLGIVRVPAGRVRGVLRDVVGDVDPITTAAGGWLGYRSRAPLDDRQWRMLGARLDLWHPNERSTRWRGRLLADAVRAAVA